MKAKKRKTRLHNGSPTLYSCGYPNRVTVILDSGSFPFVELFRVMMAISKLLLDDDRTKDVIGCSRRSEPKSERKKEFIISRCQPISAA